MRPTNRFLGDLLDLDAPEAADDVLWRALAPTAVTTRDDGAVVVTVPFQACTRKNLGDIAVDAAQPARELPLIMRAYGGAMVRLTLDPGAVGWEDSPMLERDPTLTLEPLTVATTADGWDVCDAQGRLRLRVVARMPPVRPWSDLIPPPPPWFHVTVWPDGTTAVPFMAQDAFFPKSPDSLALAMVTRGEAVVRLAWSLHAARDEHFAGTGERFARLDLAGRTLQLDNCDALGVNNRRAYKNVPFWLSSRPYGAFVHTSCHLRLSLADISTRAACGAVEDGRLDLFLIGGGSPERILDGYRRLTGRPRALPRWSYGCWMSRMSYWTAEQTSEVARRLRAGDFPCDVLHLDTGWFDQDWRCDWTFSREKYPDPAAYLAQMRRDGFRISLWQLPKVAPGTWPHAEAVKHGHVAPLAAGSGSGSAMGQVTGTDIDFSRPEAEAWYRDRLLTPLLRLGAVCIKTDFGEEIAPDAAYALPYARLHNLYALLYQRAAWEATQAATGEGIIWARSAWAGAQRYGVHWGGDCGCTWDGLAGTLRGGLHLGLSGFAFWSHDVPGFHGVPDFMNSWPDEDLYVRWTQLGVFSSHLRYHGANPREPYEYPGIADTVRAWLRLRYALIPYLQAQAERGCAGGMPLLRAMLLHHPDDRRCWSLDDQFFCGDELLVAPILDGEATRRVYLPAGRWRDLWTGNAIDGPIEVELRDVPLHRCPVWARDGAAIPYHPDAVRCTDDMDPARTAVLHIDDSFRGLGASPLGALIGLG